MAHASELKPGTLIRRLRGGLERVRTVDPYRDGNGYPLLGVTYETDTTDTFAPRDEVTIVEQLPLRDLTAEHVGRWVVIYDTELVLVGEIGDLGTEPGDGEPVYDEVSREYAGTLMQLRQRPHEMPEHNRTWVLLRMDGTDVGNGFRGDTACEVHR